MLQKHTCGYYGSVLLDWPGRWANYRSCAPPMSINANRVKDIHLISGKAWLALNETEKAIAQFEIAKALDGLNPEVLLLTSQSYIKLSKAEKAYETISNAVGLYPEDIELSKEFCIQSLKQGYYNIALTTLEELEENMNSEEFLAFHSIYKTLEEELGASNNDW